MKGEGGEILSMNKNNEILNILAENLTLESKWFLWTLIKEQRELHKEELRDLANLAYIDRSRKQNESPETQLVTSRHGLDIHAARLEGAGLVKVRHVGRVRLYSVTPLGKELFEFMTNKSTDNTNER